MKRLTNILSYLWLLLLMAVTACSDLENEVDEMQQQLQEADLVELTIHPQVPGMKAGTRSTETDALTSIKVLAFDENEELIKVADATNVTSGTTGSFSVRVPSKTRIIHFIGNLPNGVTLPDVGDSEDELKTITTSGDMSYWGYASFNSVTELKAFKGQTLSLYRNKAKISITAADGVTASIAGVANAYQYGVLVPNNNGAFNFDLDTYDYQTLPTYTAKISDQTGGAFTYVFEHPNDSKSNALNVICLVDGKYYKVVLAKKVNDAMAYYDIIRNHQYNIKINQVDTNLGKADFNAAADVNNEPINDVEVVEDKQVTLLVTTSSSSTRSYDNTTYTVTVTTTENKLTDISTLSFSGLNAGIYELTGTPTGVTDNGNSTYTVTADQAVFTFTLKDRYIGKEVSNSITFEGDGTNVVVTPATANLNLSTFAEMYEMYFDGGNLGGSNEYDKFFHTRQGTISTGDASGLETTFYDDGANSHMDKHLLMNSNNNNSFSFTIADTRYLTLLVANDGDDNTASINLIGTLSNGSSWTTAGTTEDLTNGTYNFAAEGEITTAGRLIRYTLPAGTYTLQRGNNDYLLYYMRVSEEKPTMTDIVQPTAADYSLAWSGGEWGNWTYVENVGYVVDDDAKTFILTYTGLGLTEGTLTLNNSTLKIPRGNDQTDTYTASGNSFTITNANVGTYTYTIGNGEIAEPVYKYSNFYDKIALKAVPNSNNVTVKNSVKLKLTNGSTGYNSTENNVDAYTSEMTDPRLAICSPATRINTGRSFVFTIAEDWTYKGSSKTLDDGVTPIVSQNGHTFTIAQGEETGEGNNGNETWEHPFWYTYIYYLDWGSFTDTSNANRALSTMTISTEDADVWFSYKEMAIAKSLEINVNKNPGNVEEPDNTPYEITLDFYTNNSEQGGTGQYTNSNLEFGKTDLYLKATVPDYVPEGTNIVLKMDIPNGDRTGIHEFYSYIEEDIKYSNWNTHEMTITKTSGKTDYIAHWKFVRPNNMNRNDVNITISLALAGETQYSLVGETSANVTIKGNHPKQIKVSVDGGNTSVERANTSLEYTKDGNDQLTVRVTVPDGVGVLNIEADDFNVSWADADAQGKTSGDTYTFTNSTGERIQEFILTLKEESKTPKDESLINFAYAADRWTVAPGVVVVRLSEKVVTENVIFNYNFDDNKMPQINSWFNDGSKGSLSVSDKCLAINMTTSVTNSWSAQASIDVAFEEGVEYTLSFRIKANVDINKLPMYLQEPVSPDYPERGTFVSEVDISANGDFQPFNVTIEAESTYNDGRFIIDFGHIQGIIYIDDLKLVRN